MCGLVGVYSRNFGAPEFSIFEKLLYVIVFRGEDSTGVIRLDNKGVPRVRRTVLSSPEFLTHQASDFIRDIKGEAKPIGLIGHTRAATKGEVKLANAHPFSFENVVGAHNGTIHKKFKGRENYETDSEALYKLINDEGIEAALNEVQAYDTAYALQWIDKKAKTLNFVRNDRRPLSFTYIYGQTTLLWASEKKYLDFVLSIEKQTAGVNGWRGNRDAPYFTLEPNEMMSIPLNASPAEATIKKLEVKESTYRPFHPANGMGGAATGGGWVTTDRGTQRWVPNTQATTQEAAQTSTSSDLITTPTGPRLPYKGHRKTSNEKALKSLEWLQNLPKPPAAKTPAESTVLADLLVDPNFADMPWKEETKTGAVFAGFEGAKLSEKELKLHLQAGCFCCAKTLDLDDKADQKEIRRIHWWSRTTFACDECYNTSDGDWVRHSIDDTWDEIKEERKN